MLILSNLHLYFLKRSGNKSVHAGTVKKDGMAALECLQRAFEVAISYSVYKNGPSEKLLRIQYDTELLVTTGFLEYTLGYGQDEIKANTQAIFDKLNR